MVSGIFAGCLPEKTLPRVLLCQILPFSTMPVDKMAPYRIFPKQTVRKDLICFIAFNPPAATWMVGAGHALPLLGDCSRALPLRSLASSYHFSLEEDFKRGNARHRHEGRRDPQGWS